MRRPSLKLILTATLPLLIAAASLSALSCNSEEKSGSDWVLKVNGEVLTLKELDREFAHMTYGMDSPDIKSAVNNGIRRQLLQSLVENRLLAAEALRQGISVTREEAVANAGATLDSMDATERSNYLKALDITEEDIVSRSMNDLLIRKYLRSQVFARIAMKSEDLKKYYEEHPECYLSNEKVRVRQIVVATEEEAKKALQRLESGEDFAKVAAEISQTPEKDRGGDLGFIERGSFPEPFDSIFFELPENKLSEIIRGDFGFHIVKVIDRRKAAEKPPFEKVEARVRQCYFEEARRSAEINERKRLLEEARFEYNPKYAELKVQK